MTRMVDREYNNGWVQKAVPQQIHFYKERKEGIQKGLLSWLWMFGEAKMVHGLKCNPLEDTFAAHCNSSLQGGFGLFLPNINLFMMMKMWAGRPSQLFGNVQNERETMVETVRVQTISFK